VNNNATSAGTLVDAKKPVMNWEAPVLKEQAYHTFGGNITMRVDAHDDDQISRVEFKLWDHIGGHYVIIGKPTHEPYQVVFDSDLLERGTLYQMWAFAYDRAGNYSSERIYLERLYPYYLPLLNK
jgi:hypothetical protein